MQSFLCLFLRFELVAKHHAFAALHGALLQIGPTFLPVIFLFFFFWQDSGVRAWASYDHESGASGLHNRFTRCEAKRFWNSVKNWKTTRLPSLACIASE